MPGSKAHHLLLYEYVFLFPLTLAIASRLHYTKPLPRRRCRQLVGFRFSKYCKHPFGFFDRVVWYYDDYCLIVMWCAVYVATWSVYVVIVNRSKYQINIHCRTLLTFHLLWVSACVHSVHACVDPFPSFLGVLRFRIWRCCCSSLFRLCRKFDYLCFLPKHKILYFPLT